ncbi:MAG: ATP-binding protein [Candidatus Omnitrophota bacterium]
MPSIKDTLQDIIGRLNQHFVKPEGAATKTKPAALPKEISIPIIIPERLAGVSIKYQDYSFDNFKGNEKLVRDLRDIKVESIILSGKTGCGKTHLAISMLREANLRWAAYFITIPELLLKIRGSFDSQSNETEEEIIAKFSDYELLVLDDLGAEKTTEYSITTLYLILDRRNRENRRTIITTNLSLQDIEETLGARIASRLADMKFIKINMQDYRKNR